MTTGRKNHLSFLAYTAMGLCIGIYVTFACTMSTAWNVLLIAGLLSIFTVLMTKDWLLLSIFCMSFSLPFGFSKAIVRLKESVYLPALYIQLVDFFIIGALVIWAWRLFTREEKFPTWSKTHTLAFLVVFWFAASIFWAKIPTMGFFEWLTLFKCFIFYLFISVYFRNPEVTSVFIIALLISALMQIAMTSAQQIFKDPLFFQGMKGHAKLFGLAGSAIFRPSGLCEHPNGLSSYLLYTQPIIFSLAYFYLSGIKRIFFFLVFLLSVVIHIWTFTRIGWFSMVCEAVVFIFLLIRTKRLTIANFAAMILCTAIILCILGVYHGKIIDRLFGFDNMSTKSRRVMERIAVQVILENPVKGVGFGNYAPTTNYIWPDNYQLIGKAAVKLIRGKHYVHNGYLLLTAETGFVGIIMWAAFFLIVFWRGYKNIIHSRDSLHLSLSVGFFLALFGLLINMFLEHFRYNTMTIVMWLCAGVILALSTWEGCLDHASRKTIT